MNNIYNKQNYFYGYNSFIVTHNHDIAIVSVILTASGGNNC